MYLNTMNQPSSFVNPMGSFSANPFQSTGLGAPQGINQSQGCGCQRDINLGLGQMQIMLMEMLMQSLFQLMMSGGQSSGQNQYGASPSAAPIGSNGNSLAPSNSSSQSPSPTAKPAKNGNAAPSSSHKVGKKTGNIVSVPGGKLDSSIAGNFNAMVAAAKKDGVNLRIVSSFRSRAQQEKLYAAYKNGTGNLAAKPGTSNHESGLAIDFANTRGAYAWLKKNAGQFGLKNLPGEPWHYSPSGR